MKPLKYQLWFNEKLVGTNASSDWVITQHESRQFRVRIWHLATELGLWPPLSSVCFHLPLGISKFGVCFFQQALESKLASCRNFVWDQSPNRGTLPSAQNGNHSIKDNNDNRMSNANLPQYDKGSVKHFNRLALCIAEVTNVTVKYYLWKFSQI